MQKEYESSQDEELFMIIDGIEYKIIEGVGYVIEPDEALEYGFFIDYDEYEPSVYDIAYDRVDE